MSPFETLPIIRLGLDWNTSSKNKVSQKVNLHPAGTSPLPHASTPNPDIDMSSLGDPYVIEGGLTSRAGQVLPLS